MMHLKRTAGNVDEVKKIVVIFYSEFFSLGELNTNTTVTAHSKDIDDPYGKWGEHCLSIVLY